MNTNFKIAISVLGCAVACTILVSCGSHDHVSMRGWNCDLVAHYKVCDECSESFQSDDHAFDDGVCGVCGAEVINSDGEMSVVAYNEQGKALSVTTKNGKTEYAYDYVGELKSERVYLESRLFSEKEFATIDGKSCLVTEIVYDEGGTWGTSRYDKFGRTILYARYAKDGSVESAYQYSYSGDGKYVTEKEYAGDSILFEHTYLLSGDDKFLIKEVSYEPDGAFFTLGYDIHGNLIFEGMFNSAGELLDDLTYEHTYDNDGNRIYTKTLADGVIIAESEYASDPQDPEKEVCVYSVVYHENGNITLTTQNPDGTEKKEIVYDYEGNIISEK